MNVNFNKQKLPPVYIRNGQQCYLDPIREKLIYITPEETVRQQVIAYLVNELHVPKHMIAVEEHFFHYQVHSNRRADIIVHGLDQSGGMIPLAIVECKAPTVYLDENTWNQLADYCELLDCNYALMTNGNDTFCFLYDASQDQYVPLEKIPEYQQLLQNQYSILDLGEIPDRIPYNKIPCILQEHPNEYSLDIGQNTEYTIACAGCNLLEGLLDARHQFPERQYELFRVVEDYGVRILSYGNASGGVFNGPYRSLLIEANGSTEFVSFGISQYITYAHPEKVKTALNIAIDNEKETHHSLQLVLDENVVRTGETFCFYHHGRIGVGNRGSGKISGLRALVQLKYPKILDTSKFFLGSLKYNRDWNIDDPEMVSLLENLVSYALIRDEYRAQIKKGN